MRKKLDERSVAFLKEFETKIQEIIDAPLQEQRAWERKEVLLQFDTYIDVGSIDDFTIEEGGKEIPIRIYSPLQKEEVEKEEELPIIVYYHGGGWVYKGIDELEGVCRKISTFLHCIVVSVAYRLSPEHRFPAPLEDCYDALRWVSLHSKELHGAPHLIGVAGDSAGGNLAAATCLKARDLGEVNISFQLLLYPVIDPSLNDTPFDESADQQFMTKRMMQFFWESYLGSFDQANNPYAAPLKATSHASLPKALIVTAEHDPLKFEAEAYSCALKRGGVDSTLLSYSGAIHGFIEYPIHPEVEKEAYEDIAKWFVEEVL